MARIGIYAGVFDPVHAGHVAFALQALKAAKLDRVYFMPERRPRHKQGVEHFAHRVAMLKRAALPHSQFGVLELEDISFDVKRTLNRLKRRFPNDSLVFLFGSDTVRHIPEWPDSKLMLENTELVVGLRGKDSADGIEQAIGEWSVSPRRLYVLQSAAPHVSSSRVREALYRRKWVGGLLKSVQRYSSRHWLYISFR